MDFGKSYRIGNFEVVKLSRSLSKSEIKRLRDEANVPNELRKHLTRGSLPYIKVRAISGIWAIEWSAGTAMFNLFDGCFGPDGANEPDVIEGLKGLVSRMNSLCSIVGDKQMNIDLTKALSDFLERRKANDEEDKTNGTNKPDETDGE
jgi:hypothetical protein